MSLHTATHPSTRRSATLSSKVNLHPHNQRQGLTWCKFGHVPGIRPQQTFRSPLSGLPSPLYPRESVLGAHQLVVPWLNPQPLSKSHLRIGTLRPQPLICAFSNREGLRSRGRTQSSLENKSLSTRDSLRGRKRSIKVAASSPGPAI